jgi:hypothetical protein
MDDAKDVPRTLSIEIGAFRAIAEAVTEVSIAGEVQSVTISEMQPDLQLMRGALALEVIMSPDRDGRGWLRDTWIIAGDGRVIAHLEDWREEADQG